MKTDKRAAGGFMEAMTAMMIATVALSAFMGLVAYSQAQDPPEPDVSTVFVQRLCVEDGCIVGVGPEYIEQECAMNGYDSMVIRVTAELPDGTAVLNLGSPLSDRNMTVEQGTAVLTTDTGDRVIAHYEAAVFWT